MASSSHDVRRRITSFLERVGEAGPSLIAAELGPEWVVEPKYSSLRQMLRRMKEKDHFLVSPKRGVYRLSPNYRMRGLDVRNFTESRIARFLRGRGGVARTREIHDAVGEGGERGYTRRMITQTLKRSPRFRRDFGRGCWNLDEQERERLPLLGRWAEHRIQVRWFSNRERGGFNTWEEKRDDYFDSVATAFREARGDRSIADVVFHPEVGAALHVMADAAPAARNEARDALRDEVEGEARAEGITDRWVIAQRVREREATDLGVHLYAAFERGDVALHLAAPVEFYTTCAALFGVCAARLSRGEVVEVPETEVPLSLGANETCFDTIA